MATRRLLNYALPELNLFKCCCVCDDLCPYWSGKSNSPRLCIKACKPCHDHHDNLHADVDVPVPSAWRE